MSYQLFSQYQLVECLVIPFLWPTHFVVHIQDTVTGFLLAGVGHRTADRANFLIVKSDTKLQQVEEAFQDFSTRDDIGIILINQHIANDIRHVLKDYHQTIPTVLEIPSKEHPYDPEQDYIMQRVNLFLGGGG
jgi:V-type H+-transporting ATPase subunit F